MTTLRIGVRTHEEAKAPRLACDPVETVPPRGRGH
jgi:hypothetical protein